MELSEREKEIIFNSLGRLYDAVIDGKYDYHRVEEISELHEKFYEELKKR